MNPNHVDRSILQHVDNEVSPYINKKIILKKSPRSKGLIRSNLATQPTQVIKQKALFAAGEKNTSGTPDAPTLLRKSRIPIRPVKTASLIRIDCFLLVQIISLCNFVKAIFCAWRNSRGRKGVRDQEGVRDRVDLERWIGLEAENNSIGIVVPGPVFLGAHAVNPVGCVTPVDTTEVGIKKLGQTSNVEGISQFSRDEHFLDVVEQDVCHGFKISKQEQEQEPFEVKGERRNEKESLSLRSKACLIVSGIFPSCKQTCSLIFHLPLPLAWRASCKYTREGKNSRSAEAVLRETQCGRNLKRRCFVDEK